MLGGQSHVRLAKRTGLDRVWYAKSCSKSKTNRTLLGLVCKVPFEIQNEQDFVSLSIKLLKRTPKRHQLALRRVSNSY